MNTPRDIDWDSLFERLTACALRWFRDEFCFDEEAVLPGTAGSAVELAYNAALEFFKGEKVKWRPKTPDEDPFPLIVRVMRNDFLDLIKRSEYRRTVIMDAEAAGDGAAALERLGDESDGFHSAEAASLARALYPLVKGDQELKDYIDAVCILGLRKREEIADVLGIEPRKVTDIQRRLEDKRVYAVIRAEQLAEQNRRRNNV